MRLTPQKGFTLIELVVVLMLMGLILTALFTLYERHNRIYVYEQALIRVSASGRSSMNEIVAAVLQGHRIISSQTINGTVHNTGTNTIIIEIPAIDASERVVNGAYDYAVIYASGKNLWYELQPHASSSRTSRKRLLSDTLASVSFIYDNPTYAQVKKVTANVSTSETVKNQTVSSQLQQQIVLRNY